MKAWLLSWECNTSTVAEKIAAILSSRRSDRAIAELMELLVLRANSTARNVAYYANRKRELVYKAQTPLSINRVPHGERILCGHDPWLYGRKVTDFKVVVDESADEEILTWREPDDFRWVDKSERHVEIAKSGEYKTLRRPNRPLSTDIWER